MAATRSKKRDAAGAKLPITLFLGDPVLTDPAARARIAELLAPDRLEVDLEIVRLPEQSLGHVLDSLSQVGMFGAGRCVWIRGLGAESSEDGEAFRKVLAETGLPDGYSVVATSAKLDLRSKLAKWFRDSGRLVDLRVETDRKGKLDEASVRRLVLDRLRAHGGPQPEALALDAIARRAGGDAGQLAAELDKLCLVCGEDRPLTADLVTRHMRDLGTAWVFDLTDAIGKRRFNEARLLLDGLLDAGGEPLAILGALAENMGALVEARPLLDRLPPGALRNGKQFVSRTFPSLCEEERARFRNNGWKAYFSLTAASAFDGRELRRLHRTLAQADLRMKSSAVDPGHLLFSFLLEACGKRPPANAQLP